MLNFRKALVLASSRGLGYSVAKSLLKWGAAVTIVSRNCEALQRAEAKLKEETNSDKVKFIVCDLSNISTVRQLVGEAVSIMKGLDILVLNSGGPKPGRFEDINEEDWRKIFEEIILSQLIITNHALSYLKKNRHGGRIVYISSIAASKPIMNLTASNILRPALEGLMRTIASEYAVYNISAIAIQPGRIYTQRMMDLLQSISKTNNISFDQAKQRNEEQIPLKRFGEADHFGEFVVYLLSEAGSYISGQTLVYDGGILNG